MGEEIKSALQIAMEKVEKLGAVTEEERLEWKYVPEGEKLAARYLKQDINLVAELGKYEQDINLVAELGKYEETAKRYIGKGAGDILIRNINLPRDDLSKRNNKRAEFEAKVQQAMSQQLGSFVGIKIDVEKQPQFQEEWYKLWTQLDAQYIKLLDEYKQELSAIN